MPVKVIPLSRKSLHLCPPKRWPNWKVEPCSQCEFRTRQKAKNLARARGRLRLNNGLLR